MADLEFARNLADRIRLGEEHKTRELDPTVLGDNYVYTDAMLRHGLLISENVTPLIEKRLVEVCNRLKVPRQCVTAFVHNTAEVQADCFTESSDTCVLRFSSGLVNLMEEMEFQFVVAHELGHFLLGHSASSQYISGESSEEYMRQRARELSADRLGYLGCGSLDGSAQAIIKTASGLGDEFLRFDISSFLSQTGMLRNPSEGESKNSTHPSMLIRCRSVLWFSMAISGIDELQDIPDSVIQDIDTRVIRDLERFVDGQLRLRHKELERDIALWKSCALIVSEGGFNKDMQSRLADELGLESLRGLKSFFSAHHRDELLQESSSRLELVISEAYREFPSSAEDIEFSGISKAYKIAGLSFNR